ncbi:MAG: hydroxyacylglutathione hydrolase [Epsilonproteobacteria bacterium]|nr:MAG: hydroxyacylglutathione hydrolase [Campylobacterota bacterium]
MKIHQIYTHNFLRNFTYILETSDGDYYCVDPWDAGEILKRVPHGKLKAVINTHEHDDHTQGNSELVEKENCEIWAHENAKGKIAGVTRYLSKDEKISLGLDWSMEVMDTPGHTFAHLCLLIKEKERPHAVITGDTLFSAGVGNCHNGGDPGVLYETISAQFQMLPDDVILYPGHEYLENNLKFTLAREPDNQSATELLLKVDKLNMDEDYFATDLGVEKEINTFLRLDKKSIREHLPITPTSDKEVFLTLRQLRNEW